MSGTTSLAEIRRTLCAKLGCSAEELSMRLRKVEAKATGQVCRNPADLEAKLRSLLHELAIAVEGANA